MGKVKTRILGLEEVEAKQKKEQKEKAAQKKAAKSAFAKASADKERKSVIANPAERGEAISSKKDLPAGKAGIATSRRDVGTRDDKKAKVKKKPQVKTKPRGKRYEEVKKLVDKTKMYSLKEAISLVKKLKTAKFDESVELHFVVDETGLKGEVELPHSTGKTVKVAVVDDKILAEIEKGKLNFDVLVTHPSFMPKLAKFAKVLGPKGLMPNPKAGTISPNPEEIVKKFAKGVLRWKTEAKFPLIHQMIGKISAEDKNLIANAEKFIEAVGKKHIQKAYIKSTMSPSIKLAVSS